MQYPSILFSSRNLEFPVRLDYVYRIKGFPDKEKDFTKGISACFAGIFNGHSTLMIGGGCNFPDISAADGGTKKYYRSIYAAEVTEDSLFTGKKSENFLKMLPMVLPYLHPTVFFVLEA